MKVRTVAMKHICFSEVIDVEVWEELIKLFKTTLGHVAVYYRQPRPDLINNNTFNFIKKT